MAHLLKVYGERNTNTNYLEKLIELNLNVAQVRGVVPPIIMKMQKLLPGNELVRDIYFQLTYGKNLGWKHTCAKSGKELRKYRLLRSDIAFLTITKNPYSWLLSLYRNPYHQYYSKKPSFEEFLNGPWKTVRRDNIGRVLGSPIELWNIKNKSYLQLDKSNSLNITTESIFEDASHVITLISQQLSIARTSDNFVNYEKSTKDKSKSSNYYRGYYLQEKWRDELTDRAISIINERVDMSLMSHFGYDVIA